MKFNRIRQSKWDAVLGSGACAQSWSEVGGSVLAGQVPRTRVLMGMQAAKNNSSTVIATAACVPVRFLVRSKSARQGQSPQPDTPTTNTTAARQRDPSLSEAGARRRRS